MLELQEAACVLVVFEQQAFVGAGFTKIAKAASTPLVVVLAILIHALALLAIFAQSAGLQSGFPIQILAQSAGVQFGFSLQIFAHSAGFTLAVACANEDVAVSANKKNEPIVKMNDFIELDF